MGYRLPIKAMPGYAGKLRKFPTTPFRASGSSYRLTLEEVKRSRSAFGVSCGKTPRANLARPDWEQNASTSRMAPRQETNIERRTLTKSASQRSANSPTSSRGTAQPTTPKSAITELRKLEETGKRAKMRYAQKGTPRRS